MSSESHDKRPIKVLYGSIGKSTKATSVAAWSRLGQHGEWLASQGIEVSTSAAYPQWLYPGLWTKPHKWVPVAKAIGVVWATLKRIAQLPFLHRYDVVVVCRDLWAFTGPAWTEKLWRRRAKFMIYELDDAIFSPPVPPPAGWTDDKAVAIARMSDRVIAGNEFLAEWAAQHCEDVRVIATAVPEDLEPTTLSRPPGPLRLVWTSHPSGAYMLNEIVPALEEAARRVDYSITLLGQTELMDAIDWPDNVQRDFIHWKGSASYGELNKFDVGIMPLEDDVGARGKCAFKLLRYMASGIACIASPVGMNNEVVLDGETGLFAQTHEDWVDAIVEMAGDLERASEFGAAGRERYLELYQPSAIRPQYVEALTP